MVKKTLALHKVPLLGGGGAVRSCHRSHVFLLICLTLLGTLGMRLLGREKVRRPKNSNGINNGDLEHFTTIGIWPYQLISEEFGRGGGEGVEEASLSTCLLPKPGAASELHASVQHVPMCHASTTVTREHQRIRGP